MLQSPPDFGAGTIPAISFHINTLFSSSQSSHPYWDRMDRCIDYVWVSKDLHVVDSSLCFDRPSADDAEELEVESKKLVDRNPRHV